MLNNERLFWINKDHDICFHVAGFRCRQTEMCGLKESLVDEQTDGHTGRRIKEATYKLTNEMKKLTGQPKNKMRDR